MEWDTHLLGNLVWRGLLTKKVIEGLLVTWCEVFTDLELRSNSTFYQDVLSELIIYSKWFGIWVRKDFVSTFRFDRFVFIKTLTWTGIDYLERPNQGVYLNKDLNWTRVLQTSVFVDFYGHR